VAVTMAGRTDGDRVPDTRFGETPERSRNTWPSRVELPALAFVQPPNAANPLLNATNSQIIDQNGVNGLANYSVNAAHGVFVLAGKRNFTTAAGFTNGATVNVSSGGTFRITRGYTQKAGTNGCRRGPGRWWTHRHSSRGEYLVRVHWQAMFNRAGQFRQATMPSIPAY